ncbi:AraC family transcriptional regulator [Acinetobacter corruptisaponis]|uniref:AraC family transcriptional regulator n=1 Tax=Acinetobacter corruptisaponis TaxID=3045147 RepID=A0ABY8S2K7_9GAMM|nr:AraC family transcriptional regulator [Acinetobacter sp. KCTC 92772]WHP05556.1 AraC family transcriptional regulator [Acinetobacter sp. KCTC 92772]
MRYPKGLKRFYFGGQNGLMPKRTIHTNAVQQFIPPTILASLIHYAEQQRWDYATWFKDSGLDIGQIQQTHSMIRFSQMCEVIRTAISVQQQPALGLKIGSSEGLISMGILGFAMQSCKTVADALQIALRYHRVSGSVLNIEFSIQGDNCQLEVTETNPTFDLQAFFHDELFSSIITCLNAMLGDHDDVISLELSYLPSEYFEEYQRVFGCPIQFNSDKNVMRFKTSMLARSLKNYSPANYATAILICEQTLKEIDQLNQAGYADLLDHWIEQHLPERFEMEQAAEHLQISERHLRRQLLLEGLSFQQIRQNVLERKAKQLLGQNLLISEISLKLGFSELREFRRAFKRWTGQAPSIYKQAKELI